MGFCSFSKSIIIFSVTSFLFDFCDGYASNANGEALAGGLGFCNFCSFLPPEMTVSVFDAKRICHAAICFSEIHIDIHLCMYIMINRRISM